MDFDTVVEGLLIGLATASVWLAISIAVQYTALTPWNWFSNLIYRGEHYMISLLFWIAFHFFITVPLVLSLIGGLLVSYEERKILREHKKQLLK